jgi:hypothetical protein
MEAKNVDDILVKEMQQTPQSQPQPQVSNPLPEPEHASESTPRTADPQDQGDSAQGEYDVLRETPKMQNEQKEPENAQSQSKPQDSKIDEYGNPIEPPRIYTEEEVQRMIRERLSRGRHADQPQPTNRQIEKAVDDFKADPHSDDALEQLNTFIDKRIESRQKEQREREWRNQEAMRQAEFESKFNAGMNKYQDFEHVVGKVGPLITPTMMRATSGLNDPAAFLYAAAKLHPGEIERISRLGDGVVQAAEVGRLHERMVKARNLASAAPKPIEPVKGDLPNKAYNPKLSIDQRINEYGRQKRR